MPPYKGSDALRGAAIVLFEFRAASFNQNYQSVLVNSKRHKTPAVAISQKEDQSADIADDEKRLNAAFQVQQQIFADTNQFTLANTST